MPRSVSVSQLGSTVAGDIRDRMGDVRLDQILVAQARRRMTNGGDSDHRYPDLWDHPDSFRAGGQPLLDTGVTAASLNGETERDGDTLSATLRGPLHAVYHQHGFTTKGPNFIALTLKARRTHIKGRNPKEEGLVRGKDYIMAWQGVTVPQRKIFNLPEEDRSEIVATVTEAVSGG